MKKLQGLTQGKSAHHYIIRGLLLVIVALALISCGSSKDSSGGGGSTSTTTATTASGTFVDAPVAFLTYTATPSGLTGTTNAYGQFNFKPGDSVAFSALGVSLGAFMPTVNSTGISNVTPLDLVPGNTGVTDPKVTAIGLLLNTLNVVATQTGAGASGVFVVPQSSALQTALTTLGLSAQNISSTQLQTVLDTVYTAGTYTVSSNADAQAAMAQGVTSAGIINTVWTLTCTPCGAGGATFFFQADGTVNGIVSNGGILSGSWAPGVPSLFSVMLP